jgi:gamma-glutamyltranspeptidase/glutathione hydrolase
VASITDSINYYFGSGVVIENTGILMNDTMRDFDSKLDAINSIEGGKRPRSWMSPTIVLVEDKPFLALGSAGGPKIVSSVLQVLINVIDFKMNIEEAVRAPRFHCQGSVVSIDPAIPLPIREELKTKGHVVEERGEWWFFGAVQAALVDPETDETHGTADPLRDGTAIIENDDMQL